MAKITVAFMRELDQQLHHEEITYSRMVELLNEKAKEKMIYFVGIHHKPGLPALCSTTLSGRKIDAAIACLKEPCKKVNLFSTTYIPEYSDEYNRELQRFIDTVPDGNTIVLLGQAVNTHFPSHFYRRSKIIRFRHPAFSPPLYVTELVEEILK